MSYYINRGLTGHKADNWLVQPGPVTLVTWWDIAAKAVTMLGACVLAGGAIVFGVMGFSGL